MNRQVPSRALAGDLVNSKLADRFAGLLTGGFVITELQALVVLVEPVTGVSVEVVAGHEVILPEAADLA